MSSLRLWQYIFGIFYLHSQLISAQVTKIQHTLKPSIISSIPDVNVILGQSTRIIEDKWLIDVTTQQSADLILEFGPTWGFHPEVISDLRIMMKGNTTQTTYDNDGEMLIVFSSGDQYFAQELSLDSRLTAWYECPLHDGPLITRNVSSMISATIPERFYRFCNNTEGIPITDTSAQNYWHKHAPTQYKQPLLWSPSWGFTVENDPNANTVLYEQWDLSGGFSYKTASQYTSSFPPNQGWTLHISGDTPGAAFWIFEITIVYEYTTLTPTQSPSSPTVTPSDTPSQSPLQPSPSTSPITNPTSQPSATPSKTPTNTPSTPPTTPSPTSLNPTSNPSASPSLTPSNIPSSSPTTNEPSKYPTSNPSESPFNKPTVSPSSLPSISPTSPPSTAPTVTSDAPSTDPSSSSSIEPSLSPTLEPSSSPTIRSPSVAPITSSPSSGPLAKAPIISLQTTGTINASQTSATPSSSPSTAPTKLQQTVQEQSTASSISNHTIFIAIVCTLLGLCAGLMIALCVVIVIRRKHSLELKHHTSTHQNFQLALPSTTQVDTQDDVESPYSHDDDMELMDELDISVIDHDQEIREYMTTPR